MDDREVTVAVEIGGEMYFADARVRWAKAPGESGRHPEIVDGISFSKGSQPVSLDLSDEAFGFVCDLLDATFEEEDKMKKTAAQVVAELEASEAEFVTYGEGSLGVPHRRQDAIADIARMPDEMIGEGTWYECDSTGELLA
jgi:hypothetical protein